MILANAEAGQTRSTFNLRGKVPQLHLYGSPEGLPIILSSGDLGWAGLVVHVAELLSSKGYYVIRLNSKAYLASFTSKSSTLNPQDVLRDYVALIALTLKKNRKQADPRRHP